jgi:hypothetical protein
MRSAVLSRCSARWPSATPRWTLRGASIFAWGSISATSSRTGTTSTATVSMLPFPNMSGDPEQEYFADGMVEEIIFSRRHSRLFHIGYLSRERAAGKGCSPSNATPVSLGFSPARLHRNYTCRRRMPRHSTKREPRNPRPRMTLKSASGKSSLAALHCTPGRRASRTATQIGSSASDPARALNPTS